MDPRERIDDQQEALKTMLDGYSATFFTGMPGIVISFDPDTLTASVQPALMGTFLNKDGTTSYVNLPPLILCPVFFPSGGGFTLTFPLAAGDEVFINIADKCIDGWWQSGQAQPPAEIRFHDLSDGFCFPKVWSQQRKISGVSASKAQLRSDDGETYVELAGGGVINVVAPGGFNVTAPTITLTASTKVELATPDTQIDGNLTSGSGAGSTASFTGTISATVDVVANGTSTHTHHHSGVTTGGGNSGPPV